MHTAMIINANPFNVDDKLTVDFSILNTSDGTLKGLAQPVEIDSCNRAMLLISLELIQQVRLQTLQERNFWPCASAHNRRHESI